MNARREAIENALSAKSPYAPEVISFVAEIADDAVMEWQRQCQRALTDHLNANPELKQRVIDAVRCSNDTAQGYSALLASLVEVPR